MARYNRGAERIAPGHLSTFWSLLSPEREKGKKELMTEIKADPLKTGAVVNPFLTSHHLPRKHLAKIFSKEIMLVTNLNLDF